jgi:hypothetical protein
MDLFEILLFYSNIIALVLQAYVFYVIQWKSPANMKDYKFFLLMTLVSFRILKGFGGNISFQKLKFACFFREHFCSKFEKAVSLYGFILLLCGFFAIDSAQLAL